MCLAVSGNSSKYDNWKISASSSIAGVTVSNGNRDKASAFACLAELRYSISYWYADRIIAQRCNRAAAEVGTPS